MCDRIVSFWFVMIFCLFMQVNAVFAAPFAYISNRSDGSVSVVDTATNTVTATVTLGGELLGVAVNTSGTKAYFSRVYSNAITVLGIPAHTVAGTFSAAGTVHGIAVSPDGSRLYVAIRDSGSIQVLNAATGESIATIGGMSNPTCIAVSPDGSRVYVANWTGNVVVVNAATNEVLTTISPLQHVSGIAVSPDGSRVYVCGTSSLYVIDTSTNSVTEVPGVGGNFVGVTVSADGRRVYAGSSIGVAVIDTSDNSVITTVDTGGIPSGVDINPAGTKVYAAVPSLNLVKVIDTARNTVSATIPVGATPYPLGNFIASPPDVTDGLVSLWRGEGNTLDAIGGFHGTLQGGATFGAGKLWQAFSLAGGAYVQTPAAVANFGSAPFTVGFWMYAASDPSSDAYLVGRSHPDGGAGWDIRFDDNAIKVCGVNGWGFNIVSDASVAINRWHYIAVASTGSLVTLYVDGVVKGTSPRSAISSSSNPFRVGYTTNYGGSGFNGLIDDVAIYNRALSMNEIRSLFGRNLDFEIDPAGTTPPSISGWDYDFFTMNDSGTHGSNPTADHQLVTSSARSFSGNKAVYSRIRTLGSYNQDPDYHYATHRLTTDYPASIGKKLDAVTVWRSDIAFTTSSRWFYWFMIEMTDGTNSHSAILACRDWGYQEGCTGDVQDTHDQTATGADGQTWYRHRVAVPSNLDQSRLKITIRHTERSWDGTSAESSLYYDLLGEETSNVDQTPDPFTFTDRTGVAFGTMVESNVISVSGIDYPTTISITGGEYSINGGTYTSANGTVTNGQTVRVRQAAAASYSTKTDAILTIGKVSDTFSVTTILQSFTISGSVTGGNGVVRCDSPVLEGSSSSCAIVPSAGYHVASLTDNGSDLLSSVVAGRYVISNVTGVHAVNAAFAADNVETVTVCPSCTYTTIQAAVNEASDDEDVTTVIRLQQGTYSQKSVVDVSKKIRIDGGWNADFTQRTSDPLLTVLTSGSYGIVTARAGAGEYVQLTIDNLKLTGSSSGGYDIGGGIAAEATGGGTVVVDVNGCVITGNGGSNAHGAGAGVLSHGTGSRVFFAMNSTKVMGNSVTFYNGGGMYFQAYDDGVIDSSLVNALIANNSAMYGGGIYAQACNTDGYGNPIEPGTVNLSLVNSTVTTNNAWRYSYYGGGPGGGLLVNGLIGDVALNIENSIVWGNTATNTDSRDIYLDMMPGGSLVLSASHSDIDAVFNEPAEPATVAYGSGMLNADPQFVNVAGQDYRLKTGSPAIDAANAAAAPALDMDGNSRPLGGGVDMGAYEKIPDDTTPDPFSFTPVTGASLSTTTESESITVSGINQPASISITNGEYEIGGNGIWLTTSSTVDPGASVKVRLTTSTAYNTMTTAILTIGGVDGAFSAITLADTQKPVVTAFSLASAESTNMGMGVTSFSASDNDSVSGYMVTDSATPPLPGDPGWSGTEPQTVHLNISGDNNLYAWAKDPAGNVSDPLSAPVLVSLRPVLRGVSTYYTSLAAACGDATSGETIMSLAVTVPGSVTISGDKTLTLSGGFSDGYGTANGMTTIQGVLTVGTGTLTVERVLVK